MNKRFCWMADFPGRRRLRILMSTVIFRSFCRSWTFGRESGNPTIMYIVPNVYWIDDPLATDTLQKKKGIELPSVMHVNSRSLKIVGLSEKPENIVIAGNRGSPMPATEIILCLVFRWRNCSLPIWRWELLLYRFSLSDESGTESAKENGVCYPAQLAFQEGENFCADNCRFSVIG